MEESTIQYLLEIRQRLLRSLVVIAAVGVLFMCFADRIYHAFALPLLTQLTGQPGVIAIAITSPFLIPLQAALMAAIYVTAPYWLYEIWSFIAPALYAHERKLIWGLLIFSTILFYAGTLFAYFAILPLMFHFFIQVAPAGVEVKPDIAMYWSFVSRLLFMFGLAFELPILIIALTQTNIVSVAQLSAKRPYIIIGAFVAAILLAPPDLFSQILFAVPLWGLFELGLLISARLAKRALARDA